MEEEVNDQHLYVIRRYYEMYANKETSILDLEDIGKVMRSVGLNPSNAEVREIIAKLDESIKLIVKFIDNSNGCSFDVFLETMKEYEKENGKDTPETLINALIELDTENKGYLTTDECKHLLSTYGEGLSEEEMKKFLRIGDCDGNGRVEFEDLAKILLN